MGNRINCLGVGFLCFVMFMLYVPIVTLIVYSFNASPNVDIWNGFSLYWYSTILEDAALLNAALTSLNVATMSATIAVVLGTMSAFALVKFSDFRGKSMLLSMLSAPFIIPEVIIGFSLLLLFVISEQFIGWPRERGSFTVILAHTTIGIAYVSLMVQGRLLSLDKSLEEAAMDLGASPLKVFFVITLPIISKSLIGGWLLAFTLSLDDLVIATFTSGPESTTLPMLIYSRIKLGITPQLNALASIMVGTVIFMISLIYVTNITNIRNK